MMRALRLTSLALKDVVRARASRRGTRAASRLPRGAACPRGYLTRPLCIALTVTLLSTSTPAAPQVLMATASGWRTDFRLWLHSSSLVATVGGLLAAQSRPSPGRQEGQEERDARVRRIQIFPGDVTARLGERVDLAAVAYDQNDALVGGVHFTWEARETGRNLRARITQRGEFVAQAAGRYKVTVEGARKQAHVTVTVPEFPGWRGRDPHPKKVKDVSSRDLPTSATSLSPKRTRASLRDAPHTAKASLAHAPIARPAATLFQGGEYNYRWNEGNYYAADDPENERGNPPGGPLDEGAGNGNFQLVAPIAGLPGRGLDVSLGLAYNSHVWSKADGVVTFDMDKDWPAPGWSLGFGKLIGLGNGGAMIVEPDGTRHGFTGTVTTDYYGNKYFNGHTADGTFIDYWHSAYANGNSASGVAKLPNGTIIDYSTVGGNTAYPTTITDANGNYVRITYRNYTGPQIETVTDTLGRVITFYYDANNLPTAITGPDLNGGTRTLVRLHYRLLTLDYSFSIPARVQYPTVWVIDAIYYPATSTGYWFGDGDSYSSYGMIAKVSERRSMGFSAASLNEQGTITSAGTVTRQSVYEYPLSANHASPLGDAPTYPKVTETWEGMSTGPAETLYATYQNSSPRRVEITMPNGTKSIQFSYNAPGQYYDGLVYQDETRDSNGTLLKSGSTSWEQGSYSSPRPTRTEASDYEINKKTASVFEYGPVYNQVTAVHNYDYSDISVTPTSRLRVTRTEYENGASYTNNHIFNLVKTLNVYAGDDATRVSRTEYQYEGAPLQDAPGVVMHSEQYNPYAPSEEVCGWEEDTSDPDYQNPMCTNPESIFYDWRCDGYVNQNYVCRTVTQYWPQTDYRGNVTQVKTYADAANLGGAVIETRRYDITGNGVVISSSCCEQTSLGYTSATQYAYPTSQTRGSATDATKQVTTSATYDFNTGLALTSTDANGRTSESRYYASTLRPERQIAPTGAFTLFEYNDAEMKVTDTTYTSDPPADVKIASRGVKYVNGIGQVRREEALVAGGAVDVVETAYDKLGRVWKQTQPFRSTLDPSQWKWSETVYDALGRVTRSVMPDGSEVQTFYNEASRPAAASGDAGVTTRVRDAWGRERWGRADAQGRLVEVVEPNPSGGGSVFEGGSLQTTYAYDTLGNLKEIAQGEQRRRFAYDSLGRLTRQKLAEASAAFDDAGNYVSVGGAGAQWSDVFAYDGRSNLVSRTDARGMRVEFLYTDQYGNLDPLNRLQKMRYTVPAGSPVSPAAAVSYTYVPSGDRTRAQQVTTAGVSSESFTYDGEGRVFERSLTLDSRPSYPFVTNYSYDTLDRVTDVTYPNQYGVGYSARKVVHQDYDVASRLSGVKVDGASYASQINYNAAGQTTSLKIGAGSNQLTESYDYDPATGLLAGQKVFRGTDAPQNRLLDLSYEYLRPGTIVGRSGQLTAVSDNRDHNKDRAFEYDALGRLKRAAAGGAAGAWAQAYFYDRYGNRSSVQSRKTSDFVTSLYQVVLGRNPDSGGLESWDNFMRQSYAQGQAQFMQAAKDTAAGFFHSTEYVNRNRSDHDYVRDLYLAYLGREPDAGGWAAWEATIPTCGRECVLQNGFANSGEFANRVKGMYPYASTYAAAAPADGWGFLSFDSATNRINSAGWEYDAAGNLTRGLSPSGAWQRYEYDAAGRLVWVKTDAGAMTAGYTYGDDNVRLIAEENGVRTYFAGEGGQVYCEYSEYGAATQPQWAKSYIYLGGRLLATVQSDGSAEAVQYHHPDRIGTRLVTNAADASVSEEKLTLPYGTGSPSESVGTNATSRRFTSYERSSQTKLDYAVNRHYDSLQGRFTQVDPLETDSVDPTDPQTLNLYAYCANDPVNQSDPDGLFSLGKLFSWIGKALKILTIVAVVVAAIIFLPIAPAFVFKAALWVFTNVLIPLSQMPILGAFVPIGALGSPSWNPDARLGAFSFQGLKDNLCPRSMGCHVEDSVSITAKLHWWERGVWRKIGIGLEGFADEVTFGFTTWYNRKTGWWSAAEAEWLKQQGEYKWGGRAGVLTSVLIPLPGPGKLKVLSKGAKFFKEFEAGGAAFGHSARQIGRFTEFAVNVPGRNGISFTRWVKVVNQNGRTVRLFHDTFDSRTFKFIHRHVKL
jgi:RHS repeat-associated protein